MGWVGAEFGGEGCLGSEDDLSKGWWVGGLVCSRLLVWWSFSDLKMAAPSLVLFIGTIYFGESER